jgi:6-phospho-beta-glucosidase
MRRIKIVVIGAGSTYTPEIIEGLINAKERLEVGELALMDIDARKLDIVGGFSERMLKAAGMNCVCTRTTELESALYGAHYVLVQIRVGGMAARILDEKIPLKYGLIGQETTGIGGFFKGLRTIPELMKISGLMQQLCPAAFLINFSNPSGMVAQALLDHGKTPAIGLCNVPVNMLSRIRRELELPDAEIEYVGLNHLSWVTAIKSGGKDYLQEASLAGGNFLELKNLSDVDFDPGCIRMAGGIPNSYLSYYYYREKELKKLLTREKTRGEMCAGIERELLEIYSSTGEAVKPELLNQRGGALYSTAAVTLLEAIENNKKELHVVNIKNNGALPFMEEGDVVEIPAVMGADGAHPVPVKYFGNRHIITMMRTIKQYERHAVNAALYGDVDEAMRALCIHPLIGDYVAARDCFQELLKAHSPYLPQFGIGR